MTIISGELGFIEKHIYMWNKRLYLVAMDYGLKIFFMALSMIQEILYEQYKL